MTRSRPDIRPLSTDSIRLGIGAIAILLFFNSFVAIQSVQQREPGQIQISRLSRALTRLQKTRSDLIRVSRGALPSESRQAIRQAKQAIAENGGEIGHRAASDAPLPDGTTANAEIAALLHSLDVLNHQKLTQLNDLIVLTRSASRLDGYVIGLINLLGFALLTLAALRMHGRVPYDDETLAREHRQTQEELRESEERLRALADHAPIGIFQTDASGGCLYVNPAWCEIIDTTPNEALGSNWTLRLHPEDRRRVQTALDSAFQSGSECAQECRLPGSSEESVLWIGVSVTPLWHDGQVCGYIGTLQDITARKLEEQRAAVQAAQIKDFALRMAMQKEALESEKSVLEIYATTDPLTGLKNRRAFQERVEDEFSNAEHRNFSLSLLVIDVDNFKAYNDEYGHPAGDHVLQVVASILRTNAREDDFVARYGGEEFVALLPGTSYEGALAFGKRLCAAVEAVQWPLRPVTVSIGAATRNQDTLCRSLLFAEADRAMYHAKSKGRNRVVHVADVPRNTLVLRTRPPDRLFQRAG